MTARLTWLLLGVSASLLTACGTIATPEWSEDVENTRVALAATDDYLTEIAPTATPTTTPSPTPTVTPSPTALPPTATPLPPTETPVPPTEAPTEVPAEPEAAAGDPLEAALAAGDPEAGMAVFNAQWALPDNQPQWACSSCHSVDPSQTMLIGPGLWNVVQRDYIDETESQNAVEYIRNSILHPQDFIAPLPADSPMNAWSLLMPHGWEEALSEQELNDVVAYLVTLRDAS